ncbi:hypothetical protein PUN4_890029 [Paraburkholderia unamae]|nr:hypothetical protein PUN4_890029 [Paraburkholderia unamae]
MIFSDNAATTLYCLILPTACSVGGGKRDRTADLLHAMQALSQLSYTPLQNRSEIININFAFVKSF